MSVGNLTCTCCVLPMHYALDSSKCRHCAFGLKAWSRHVKTYLNLPFALHIMPCRTVTRLARNAMQTCQNMQKPRVFLRALRRPSSPRSGGLSQFGHGHFPVELMKYPRLSRPSSASCRDRNSNVTLQQFLCLPADNLYISLHVFTCLLC